MLMYHCKVMVGADMLEIMSFTLHFLSGLLMSGWLPMDTPCLPGALI